LGQIAEPVQTNGTSNGLTAESSNGAASDKNGKASPKKAASAKSTKGKSTAGRSASGTANGKTSGKLVAAGVQNEREEVAG